MIEGAEARLVYLPSYSPDCNPIELALGKLKARLHRADAWTQEALKAAVSPAETRGFYAHCGSPIPVQPGRRP